MPHHRPVVAENALRGHGAESALWQRAGRTNGAALLISLAVVTAVARDVSAAEDETAAEDKATRSLLDEVIAGHEANLALIQHGTAIYETKVTSYLRAAGNEPFAPADKPRVPFESEVTVQFDYPRLRFDWKGVTDDSGFVTEEIKILDTERLIEYQRPGESRNPNAHNVLIYPLSFQRPLYVHPREQDPDWSIAESIRAMRKQSDVSFRARREPGGLICYDVEMPRWRGRFCVSPAQGYCVVRTEQRNRRPDGSDMEPIRTFEASVRKANNGAYVLERRTRHESVNFEGKVLPAQDEEVTLVEIDLLAQPDEKVFTLDSLNLPVGATVQDRIEGRQFEYAVAAVREPEINVPGPSGPMRARHWLTAAYVAAGVGLVLLGFLIHRFGRRRKGPVAGGDQH